MAEKGVENPPITSQRAMFTVRAKSTRAYKPRHLHQHKHLLTYTNVHWRQMTKLSESCFFFSQLLLVLVLIIISIPWKKMKHLLIFLARYVGLSVKLSLWHKLANTHVSTAHWAALCVRQPIQDAYFAKDVVARRFGGILKRIKTNRALFVERALLPSRFCCCRRRRRRPAAAAATFGARLFFCF